MWHIVRFERTVEQNISYHTKPVDEIFGIFKTTEKGLSNGEIESRREKYGRNRLKTGRKKGVLVLLLSQVNNPVIYLLLAAVTVSFVFQDIPEAIAIIIVIVLNAMIGFWMEYRAQSSLDALKNMDPLKVRVTRDEQSQEIEAQDLVPGDFIHLDAGDIVPADARITSSSELSADESPLTGESVPVPKQTEPLKESVQVAERSNMLFKGTAITAGKAEAIVVATGMDTEIGRISAMVSESDKDEIPLNKKLRLLARRLIWLISGLSLLYFLFGWIAGKEIYTLIQTAIAWTVAAIPEGLPIVATISLARGMLRLADRNVLVRNLSAVETLGETTMILTDKTGTLTMNKLTLRNISLVGGKEEHIDSSGPNTKGAMDEDGPFRHFFDISVLCNDAGRSDPENTFQGDPLDAALLEYGEALHTERFHQLHDLRKINEDPFDSEAMMMGTVHYRDDRCYVAAKGATSAILEKCTHHLEGKEQKEINKEFRETWINSDQEKSARGLKVIGFAFKEMPAEVADQLASEEEFIGEMVFVGIAGFIDPVREDVREPLDWCHQAGIKIVMVTGDHPGTALHIAQEINLEKHEKEQVIHGSDLNEAEEKDVSETHIFARVDPSQKLDIVEHFQKAGEIVGMTGDGVNDAPALKKADIGIAMGKRGTQLAKDVADMILQDDAFPSIVKAVEQGRVIFENIRKFIVYQLSYHLAEIIIIAAISFTLFKLPLLPLQLLFLNLLSDVFPALALGVGKGSRHIMEKPPKDPEEPIITRKNWMMTGLYGVVIAIYVIGAYLYAFFGLGLSEEMCNNVAFFSLAFSQLLHVFDMREPDEPLWNNQVTRNKYIWLALGLCLTFLFAAYYIPTLNGALSFQTISPQIWGIILAASVLPILTNQLLKSFEKRF